MSNTDNVGETMENNIILQYIGDRQCAVLGLGVSNLPLVRLLCTAGRVVRVYDKHTPEELGKDAVALRDGGVQFFQCGKSFEGIEGDLIFRSPGIRPDVDGIRAALSRGAELISEIELFLRLTPAHTYALTGSDGKTTSTTLTGKFLEEQGKAEEYRTYVGGNIGQPLLTECTKMSSADRAVLELSSFQLMTLDRSPSRVAITNVSPNHLDWHRGMEEYIDAKKRIIGADTRRFVTNCECECTLDIAREVAGTDIEIVLFSSKKHSFSRIFEGIQPVGRALAVYERDGYIWVCDGKEEQPALDVSLIKLPGRHNLENYMTAIGLTWGDVSPDVYESVAESFYGVEHRLELVRSVDGVSYYNSSIDSSPTRTAAALSALSDRSIVLICGGYDKNIPYAPLAEAICTHGGIRAVVLTGATGDKIGREIELYEAAHGNTRDIPIYRDGDFTSAVCLARQIAREGDCVLLSPASASFDAFKNFAERGNTFKRIVMGFGGDATYFSFKKEK